MEGHKWLQTVIGVNVINLTIIHSTQFVPPRDAPKAQTGPYVYLFSLS